MRALEARACSAPEAVANGWLADALFARNLAHFCNDSARFWAPAQLVWRIGPKERAKWASVCWLARSEQRRLKLPLAAVAAFGLRRRLERARLAASHFARS